MEQARRLDFITRAMRKEELPKLQEKSRQEIEAEIKQDKEEWETAIKEKRRCERMFAYRSDFEKAIENVCGYHYSNTQSFSKFCRIGK